MPVGMARLLSRSCLIRRPPSSAVPIGPVDRRTTSVAPAAARVWLNPWAGGGAQGRSVTEAGRGHDDGVGPAAEDVIEDPLEACRVVLRLDDQRHQSLGLEPVWDSPHTR